MLVSTRLTPKGRNGVNRRRFLGAAVCAVPLFASSSLRAQTPEATPSVFEYELDGRTVAAARMWQAETALRRGAYIYSTTIDVFRDEAHAAEAFRNYHAFMEHYLFFLGGSSASAVAVKERETLAAPDPGHEQIAESLTVEIDSRNIRFATLFAREGAVLHKWFGAGWIPIQDELFALAEATMMFADIDTESDNQVLSLLPALEDMPQGFFLDEEEFYRFDSNGKVIVSATPTDNK